MPPPLLTPPPVFAAFRHADYADFLPYSFTPPFFAFDAPPLSPLAPLPLRRRRHAARRSCLPRMSPDAAILRCHAPPPQPTLAVYAASAREQRKHVRVQREEKACSKIQQRVHAKTMRRRGGDENGAQANICGAAASCRLLRHVTPYARPICRFFRFYAPCLLLPFRFFAGASFYAASLPPCRCHRPCCC